MKDINWNKIKAMYPDSYNYYIEWNCAKNEDCPSAKCYEHSLRNLYDFFDANNLNVFISADYYHNGMNWLYNILWHTPNSIDIGSEYQYDGTGTYGDNNEYETRKEAEVAAFTHAFKLLEPINTAKK
jgi:hypothetical protein